MVRRVASGRRRPDSSKITVSVAAVGVVMSAMAAIAPGAQAVERNAGGTVGPAGSLSVTGGLLSVAASSDRGAWAVGFAGSIGSIGSPKALIARWNGRNWTLG